MRQFLLAAIVAVAASTSLHAEEWALDVSWRTPADLARIAPHFQHLKVDRVLHTASLIADDAQLALLDELGVEYRIDMVTTANMRQFYAEAFSDTRNGIPAYRSSSAARSGMALGPRGA